MKKKKPKSKQIELLKSIRKPTGGVTRVVPSKKGYNRKRDRNQKIDDF